MVFRLLPLVVAIAVIAGLATEPSPVSFFKEEIVFTICAPDTIEVRGCYWFRNATNDSASTTIFYPFPVGQYARFPHYIAVSRPATSERLPFRSLSDGIEWPLRLSANTVDSIGVLYRQKVQKGFGEYIVSTTKQWGIPLQKADFFIRVPQRMTLSFWSFRADSIDVIGDTVTYRVRYNAFFPDSEMIVRWKW